MQKLRVEVVFVVTYLSTVYLLWPLIIQDIRFSISYLYIAVPG